MQVAQYLKQSHLYCVMHVIMPVYLLLRLKTAVEKENEMTPTRLQIKRLHQLTTKNKLDTKALALKNQPNLLGFRYKWFPGTNSDTVHCK